MDALLFMVLSIAIVLLTQKNNDSNNAKESMLAEEVTDTERIVKTNELFYEDDNAFSEIINALGFPKEG